MMNDRERLEENVLDSVLALLMDEYAVSEGERYMQENERLQNDPDAAVPAELERRALQMIERECAKKNRRRFTGKQVLRAVGRLAIAAAIIAALFVSAMALSPSLRNGTLNVLRELDMRMASWQFIPSDAEISGISDSSPAIVLEVGWVPEGFSQNPSMVVTPFDIVNDYINDAGALIRVSVHASEDFLHTLDLEDADLYSDITIQGGEGICVVKNGTTSISWVYNNTDLVVCVESSQVEAESLVLVAESVNIFE